VEGIRAGGGPAFLELRTYRFRAHSMYDPELYRSKEEVEEWKRRDPIPALAARLSADGLLTRAELDALGAAADAEVAEAVAAAEAAPWEPVSDLARDVHGEGAA
jgi:pyruvate dehydrogenase E1 component alpha subunit